MSKMEQIVHVDTTSSLDIFGQMEFAWVWGVIITVMEGRDSFIPRY